MKLTILGCNGAYPEVSGATSGYLLQHNDINILIDCGSGVISRLNEFCAPGNLDMIILSHLHHDHCSDMGVLSYQLGLQDKRKGVQLSVFLPNSPLAAYGFIKQMSVFDLIPIENNKIIDLDNFHISFLPVDHPVTTFAIRVECRGKVLTYTADTRYMKKLEEFANKSDLLLCDASVTSRKHNEKTPHMSSNECGKLAYKANVKKLMLTHLLPDSIEFDILFEAKVLFSNTVIAQDKHSYEI